ncbi:MAG: hypothetical protein JXQ90_07120 [Cyclobacteriaceae bacterium]
MNIRKSIFGILTILFALFTLTLISCDESADALCDQCEADAPWSTATFSGDCYADQETCESSEDEDCIQCT